MRKNIFAYTNGAQVPSCIEMPRDELANLAAGIGDYLEATAPAAPETKAKK